MVCAEILYRVRLGQRARPHADRDTGDGEGKGGRTHDGRADGAIAGRGCSRWREESEPAGRGEI